MGKTYRWLLPWLILTAILLTCSEKKEPTEPGVVKEDPSFSRDIQPIFNLHCGLAGCHGAEPGAAGLNLSAGRAYVNLVNIPSVEVPALLRVAPGDPENSYLVIKIEGRQTVGERMPVGGILSDQAIQLIRNWVAKGAKNN